MHRAKAMTIAGTLGFAIVSVIVILGGAVALDEFVYRSLASLSGPLFVYVTELGSVKVLISLAFVGMVFLFWRGHQTEAFQLPLVVIGTLLLTQMLKLVYSIERPLIDAALDATTYSFPSGHASGSLALYGLVAFGLYRRKFAPVWIGGLIVLLVAVSFSRVILNVHYFSDVLGGWLIAFTVIAGSEWIVRRKQE